MAYPVRMCAKKGFSLGRFSDDYLKRFRIAIIRFEGRPVAFANLLETYSHDLASLDLMRAHPDAPKLTMEFMMVGLIQHYKSHGYARFSLGMVPLSGLQPRRGAPLTQRLGSMVFRRGEQLYNFQGLRRFKDKFQPDWEPRYMAVPAGLDPLVALADTAALIAGGLDWIGETLMIRRSWRYVLALCSAAGPDSGWRLFVSEPPCPAADPGATAPGRWLGNDPRDPAGNPKARVAVAVMADETLADSQLLALSQGGKAQIVQVVLPKDDCKLQEQALQGALSPAQGPCDPGQRHRPWRSARLALAGHSERRQGQCHLCRLRSGAGRLQRSAAENCRARQLAGGVERQP